MYHTNFSRKDGDQRLFQTFITTSPYLHRNFHQCSLPHHLRSNWDMSKNSSKCPGGFDSGTTTSPPSYPHPAMSSLPLLLLTVTYTCRAINTSINASILAGSDCRKIVPGYGLNTIRFTNACTFCSKSARRFASSNVSFMPLSMTYSIITISWLPLGYRSSNC